MFDFVSAGFCRGNSVSSEQQRRAAMSCEGCSAKFTVFKRRRQCSVCLRHYCTHCLPLGGQNGSSNTASSVLARFSEKKLKCSKCEVLTARPLSRSRLRQLKVKDLQLYLTSQKVSTRGCVEKDDLVNLLITHASGGTANAQKCGGSSEPDQRRTQTNPTVHSFPSTSDTPQSSTDMGASENERRKAAEEKRDSTREPSASMEPEPTISTSSSSSSWCPQPSSSGIDIVEITDSSLEQSPADSGPEPLITIIDDESPQRETSASDENRSSLPDGIQIEEALDTLMEVDEEVGNAVMAAETAEEMAQEAVEEFEGEPIITTQACTGITLSSFSNVEDLEKLTVKQLKELLALNRVDYRGCCEKPELLERVTRLWEDDNEARKEVETMSMDELCKICMDAPVECVMLECGHMATCTACGKQLSECPICRQFVVRVVRTFRA